MADLAPYQHPAVLALLGWLAVDKVHGVRAVVDGEAAVILELIHEAYHHDEIMPLLEIIAQSRPDEATLVDGKLRLWWD